MKTLITTVLMLMVTLQLFAQGQESALVKTLNGSEKIYVVVVCVAVILLGLLIYLFLLDKRLKKLEKKSSDKN